MANREPVKKSKDEKIFRKTAIRVRQINQREFTPRGGIRL